ncbi:hypothetical protein PROFUN_03577 [Planoprotostelium fungivorum]|uniref:PLAC8 family protein n=1 Tax=Planoprotostelium fungivorum TaxID=1890364 RepID=A0A2P6MSI0_9EUKA|nr:hypothetical protein PROFUN_03577 [Planoprotostelium fungivorum]
MCEYLPSLARGTQAVLGVSRHLFWRKTQTRERTSSAFGRRKDTTLVSALETTALETMSADFSTDLCGCFEDIGSCLLTCICFPITHAQNEALLAERECGFTDFLCALTASSANIYFNRQHIRSKYGMERGQECSDCCVVLFCGPCATCQHNRELTRRKEALLQFGGAPPVKHM